VNADTLRFSASYASRYHNCHGSANLAVAIPGFTFEKKEKAKARDYGSSLHGVLEYVLLESRDRLRDAAILFREIADVRGEARRQLLNSERKYITWWFLKHNSVPPVEFARLEGLSFTEETKDGGTRLNSTPLLIRFLGDVLDKIQDILDRDPNSELIVERSRIARWLKTKPRTTADIVIRQGNLLVIIDLKMGSILVEAMGNEQLLYYAATYRESEEEIELYIFQAKGNFDPWIITDKFLESWMKKLQDSETAILAGDVSLTAGKHCTFCPANPQSRGDRGTPSCPVMVEVLFGERDLVRLDASIMEGLDDE